MFTIILERPRDATSIKNIYEVSFGPGRHARAAERLRETNAPVSGLCFIALEDGVLVGSVRFWPIVADSMPGLLLGPLAVQPLRRCNGVGVALMETGLDRAAAVGAAFVLLVGDAPYYARAGFKCANAGRFEMPGPVHAQRLLVRELNDEGAKAGGQVGISSSAAFPPPCAQQRAANE